MTKPLTLAEQEFLLAFVNIQHTVIVEEYRAFYDEDGWVTFYAANNFPEGDNWISITKEQYVKQDYQWLRLVNGKLIKQIPSNKYRFSLTKSCTGVKVVRGHAGIVIEPDEIYDDVEYYDQRHN